MQTMEELGHVHNVDINKPLAQTTPHTVCHLPGKIETGVHLWKAHFSSVAVAIESEDFSIEVGLRLW
jgi:hypothetical protein